MAGAGFRKRTGEDAGQRAAGWHECEGMMAKQVKDFRPATRNANRHTQTGLRELSVSVQRDGWIGAMTAAADGEMFDGSARLETVADALGLEAEPIVVETDGTRPVVVVRKDIPRADDPRAVRLGLAANRVAELDLSWDVEILAGCPADALDGLWTPEQIEELADVAESTKLGAPGSSDRGELDSANILRMVIAGEDVSDFERALKATGCVNRAAALITVCRAYLDEQAAGQLDFRL